MIKEEIKNIKETNKDLRKFGLTVGTVLILLAAFFFWKKNDIYFYFGLAGSFLVLAGLISPIILKPLNKLWMILAILMGWVMTRVILSILFYFVITPIGLIAKIFNKKFLDLNKDKNQKTYWELREKRKITPVEYERQF